MGFMSFGDPKMHDRAIAEVGGNRSEAGVGERVAEAPISRCREAETLRHLISRTGKFSVYVNGVDR